MEFLLKLTFSLLVYFIITINAYSQVTIGSGLEPAKGALLDLKEQESVNGEANASKGLMLPRVHLTDKKKLFPMLEDTDSPGTGNQSYTNPSDIAKKNNLHIGLLVYNVNQCTPFGTGTYVWNGIEWESIFNSPATLSPNQMLALVPDTIHIPSGFDKRPYTATGFTLEYNVAAFTSNLSWSNWQSSIQSGLSFGESRTILQPGNIANPSVGGIWVTEPAVFSILPNKLPISTLPTAMDAITNRKPWYTKESKISFNIPGNVCDASGVSKQVVLNQTNYAMAVKESDYQTAIPYLLYTIRNYPASKTIYLQGNTIWQLSTNTSDSNVDISSIIQSIDNYSGGTESSDGNYSSSPVTITGANGGIGSKGTYSSLVFADPTGKAQDVILNVMQCLGSLNTSGVNIVEAQPAETSQSGNVWGTAVVRHKEKANVYKEFYSSYFGNAGRWMITNVAASAYDGITVVPNLTVRGDSSPIIPYMVYPQENYGDNLSSSAYYNQHPEYGYLYNYPAASGRSNLEKPQGICPQGWHLPNEDEWMELRTVIEADPARYALNYTTNTAAAMINACEQFAGGAIGLSKPLSEGGFNIFLMGYAFDLKDGRGIDMQEIKGASVFWTSTLLQTGPDISSSTFVYDNTTNVFPLSYFKDSFLSIRCKKND